MTASNFSPLGVDLFGDPIKQGGGPLADQFTFPPFTVLNAATGKWQDRKRAWLAHGIQSEIGRNVKAYNAHEWAAEHGAGAPSVGEGMSIFDPVVCELVYRWFCRSGGAVLDPFAGGSVRGVVASLMGYNYTGIELSGAQVDANRSQLGIAGSPPPVWIEGDSADVLTTDVVADADLVFSCPPYHDLEVYSDNPRDLSAMSWDGFLAGYRTIIKQAVQHLRDDAFAVFVVGDLRGDDGNYRNLPLETVEAFVNAGCALYNEVILVTPAGTLPVRTAKQFRVSRKMGRQHQTILVFVKGNGRRAASRIELGA